MSLSNAEVLEGLTKQQQELESAINQLSSQLENAKTQYLKVSGAIDVLSQIEESNNPQSVDTEVDQDSTEG